LITLLSLMALASFALNARSTGVVNQIEFNPNPMEKYTTITIILNQPASIGVNVETETGTVIKTLYWGQAEGQIQFGWDRLADNGTTVPSGSYVLVVNFDTRYTSIKKTLILK
ncbi:MAG TPA: FlgD immunoglobulin-like domain containing protein, partial [Candidatus Syntrophosphaera sp.]|nr:FlgD immunoglobulin-like domain containing protein [Candidatus Syntrophosphaera sp.]